jgi:hypothetical protein
MALLQFWLRLELNRMLRGTYTRPCAAEHDDLLLPHPRSLSRADLARVRSCPDEWTVAAKLDGVRALLVACVFMGRRCVCAVGRRLDVVVLSEKADGPDGRDGADGLDGPDRLDGPDGAERLDGAESLDGLVVVVDAERTGDEYHAHDVFVLSRSSDIARRAHAVRMAAVPSAIAELGLGLHVHAKPFVPMHRIADVASVASCDGLILANATAPVTFGSGEALLKWKPVTHCSVDLLVERRRCGAYLSRRASARASNGRKPLFELELVEVPGPLPCVWEFRHDGERWRPCKPRRDKNTANSEYVVTQTALNIAERITLEELHETLGPLEPLGPL